MKYKLSNGLKKTSNKAAGLAAGGVLAASSLGPIALVNGASAASLQMAAGNVGYTAYGLHRNAKFEAFQVSTKQKWNVVGSYVFMLQYNGSSYSHDINITSQNDNSFSGTGGTPAGGTYTYNETVSGTVNGKKFTMTSTYTENGYQYTVNGTINSMGGITITSWSDSNGLSSGTWSVSGTAAKVMSDLGQGVFIYHDADHNSYRVNVKYFNSDKSQHKAWLAGPVVSASNSSWKGDWLFAEVYDGGTPGRSGDEVWGSFTTQANAVNGVMDMSSPADGPFNVTRGNLVVDPGWGHKH